MSDGPLDKEHLDPIDMLSFDIVLVQPDMRFLSCNTSTKSKE